MIINLNEIRKKIHNLNNRKLLLEKKNADILACHNYLHNYDFSLPWSKGYGLLADRNGTVKNLVCGTETRLNNQEMAQYLGFGRIYWIKMGSTYDGLHPLSLFVTDILPQIDWPFTLITSDGDLSVPEGISLEIFQKLVENTNLIKWYTQNLSHKWTKMVPLPIGLDLHTDSKLSHFSGLKTQFQKSFDKPWSDRRNMIYADCVLNCTSRTRAQLKRKLLNDPNRFFVPSERQSHSGLLKSYSRHRFVLSVEGNGIDCHRTWEAILCGCIPLVSNKLILSDDLEQFVIRVDQWSDLFETSFQDDLNNFKRSNLSFDDTLEKLDLAKRLIQSN